MKKKKKKRKKMMMMKKTMKKKKEEEVEFLVVGHLSSSRPRVSSRGEEPAVEAKTMTMDLFLEHYSTTSYWWKTTKYDQRR